MQTLAMVRDQIGMLRKYAADALPEMRETADEGVKATIDAA